MSEFQIPASISLKRKLVRSITKTYDQDMKSFLIEKQLDYDNGLHQLSWAFLYTRVSREVLDGEVLAEKRRRGPWPFTVVFDSNSKYLYILMKKKRFKYLSNTYLFRKKPHYIDAASSLNSDVDQMGFKGYQYQMEWLPDLEKEEKLQEMLKDLLKEQYKEARKLIIITFAIHKGELESVNAILPSPNLDIVYEEDWSNYIEVEYDKPIVDIYVDEQEDEDEDIGVKLRGEYDESKEEINELVVVEQDDDDKEEDSYDVEGS